MKILKVLWILGFALAILALPGAMILGSTATEVLMINPHDEDMVAINRDDFSLESPDVQSDPAKVIALYGNAAGDPVKVLFVPEEKIIRPEEMPNLVLLPVDRQKGEDPLQVQMVLGIAQVTTVCSAICSSLLLGLWFLLRLRKKPAAPSGE